MCPECAAAMESMARPRASLAAVARAAILSTAVAASAILRWETYTSKKIHEMESYEIGFGEKLLNDTRHIIRKSHGAISDHAGEIICFGTWPPRRTLAALSREVMNMTPSLWTATDLTDAGGADSRESLNTSGDGRSRNSKHRELHGCIGFIITRKRYAVGKSLR